MWEKITHDINDTMQSAYTIQYYVLRASSKAERILLVSNLLSLWLRRDSVTFDSASNMVGLMVISNMRTTGSLLMSSILIVIRLLVSD